MIGISIEESNFTCLLNGNIVGVKITNSITSIMD